MRRLGSCHCKAIVVIFSTAKPLAPRACQCGFCRRHGARCVSDPDGSATLRCAVEPTLYRFGQKAIDFILCPRCGTYLGAMMGDDDRLLATLNLNAFEDPRPDLEAAPVSYDAEGAADRAARRLRLWTPLHLQWPARS